MTRRLVQGYPTSKRSILYHKIFTTSRKVTKIRPFLQHIDELTACTKMSTLPAPTDEKSDSSLPKEKEINSPDSPDTVALNEIEIVDKVSAELTISETTEKTEGKSVIEPNNDATNATDNAEKSSEKSGENTENTVEPKEKVPDGVAAASVTKNSVDDAKSEKTNATLPSSSVKGTTNTTSAANTNGNGVCKSVGGKAVNWIETGTQTYILLTRSIFVPMNSVP